jgi:hypothetical protein
LADECRRRLTEQKIFIGNPGTILKDIEILLEHVGSHSLEIRSGNTTLPTKCLPELNSKVSHPIDTALKRPLLRNYPNLAGLFVLLRAMDLLQVKGNRLVFCPAALQAWRALNPTEQYFSLLEALLFEAQSSVLGAGHRRHQETQSLELMALFLGQLTEKWRDFDHYESVRTFGPEGQIPSWSLFALLQLGLLELQPSALSETERMRYGGRGWLIGRARLTAWGKAVAWALLEFLTIEEETESGSPDRQLEFEAAVLPAPSGGDAPESIDLANQVSMDEETEFEESTEEYAPTDAFGILLPLFQPYFPEWRMVYSRPKRETPAGAHIFKVSLAGWRTNGESIWRRLAAPPSTSLDTLAIAILDAFKFDDDHLYDFRYRDERGRNRVYNRPETSEGPFTSDITVGETELAVKDEMLFTFDYGDDWKFKVRLEKIDRDLVRLRKPKVIESAGKAPDQYPESDW